MFYLILLLDLDFFEIVLYFMEVENIAGYLCWIEIMLDFHNFVILIELCLVVDSICYVIFDIWVDYQPKMG